MKLGILIIYLITILSSCTSSAKKDVQVKQLLKDSTLNQLKEVNDTGEQVQRNTTVISQTLLPFIPKQYQILDSSSGNLNGDAFPDKILILYKIGEESFSDNPPLRPLLILAGQPDGSYQLMAENDKVVMDKTKGGACCPDPYAEIKVDEGKFGIGHIGGTGAHQWEETSVFQYSRRDKKWYVFANGVEYMDTNQLKTEGKKNLLKAEPGRLPFEKFDIYEHDEF